MLQPQTIIHQRVSCKTRKKEDNQLKELQIPTDQDKVNLDNIKLINLIKPQQMTMTILMIILIECLIMINGLQNRVMIKIRIVEITIGKKILL